MATQASRAGRANLDAQQNNVWRKLTGILPTREIGIVLLVAVALFVLLALVSYHPSDPSFSFVSNHQDTQNLAGQTGAYLADLLFFLLGVMAWVVPFGLLFACGRSIFSGPQSSSTSLGLLLSIRITGWFAVILCSCVLLQLHSVENTTMPNGSGGLLGLWLANTGLQAFGWVGLSVLALCGVLVGCQAATGFSWIDVAELVGRTLHIGAGIVLRQVDIWRDKYKHYLHDRQQRKIAEQQKRDSQPLVKRVDVQRANTGAKPSSSALDSSQNSKPAQNKASNLPDVQILPQVKERPSHKASQRRLFSSNASNEMPDLDLLDERASDADELGFSEESLQAMSKLLELKLADFGVQATVESVLPGPVVTRFELQPAAGVKVQKISALAKDLARSLAVISVRIVEVIPGKSVVGIEIPNEHREIVRLREVLASDNFQNSSSSLTLALGKDIAGQSVVADVAKMPHLLVAGTTGSGKSVGVNAMLLSILYKAPPEEVRLILVDPKMLELSVYEGIPHLLAPVVTDMKEAAHALNWCVGEMERRYKLMAALGVRNLSGFNRQVREAAERGEPITDPLWTDELEPAPELATLPNIVVVIDEFADMMMMVGKKVEQLIARIAQKARAAGIHLILATQRPSVDVITGLIKANIPTRMGFQVSSKVDSRTILDQGGAEQLLGHGDMLYLPPGTAVPLRVHGAFVSDDEVHRVVSDWKHRGTPQYLEEILAGEVDGEPFVQLDGDGSTEQEDELYDEAVQFVIESRRASISAVQRKLRIGYNRAARLIEAMEAAGLVTPMSSNGSREVVVPNRD